MIRLRCPVEFEVVDHISVASGLWICFPHKLQPNLLISRSYLKNICFANKHGCQKSTQWLFCDQFLKNKNFRRTCLCQTHSHSNACNGDSDRNAFKNLPVHIAKSTHILMIHTTLSLYWNFFLSFVELKMSGEYVSFSFQCLLKRWRWRSARQVLQRGGVWLDGRLPDGLDREPASEERLVDRRLHRHLQHLLFLVRHWEEVRNKGN